MTIWGALTLKCLKMKRLQGWISFAPKAKTLCNQLVDNCIPTFCVMIFCFNISSITNGCKHSKVDLKYAPVYLNHNCFGQTPKSGSKVFFKLMFFPK
jgi:hypothetical protein